MKYFLRTLLASYYSPITFFNPLHGSFLLILFFLMIGGKIEAQCTATFEWVNPIYNPCLDSTFQFQADYLGATSYNWTPGNGTVIAGQGTDLVTVRWTSFGNADVYLSVTDGGCSDIWSMPVDIDWPGTEMNGPSTEICDTSQYYTYYSNRYFVCQPENVNSIYKIEGETDTTGAVFYFSPCNRVDTFHVKWGSGGLGYISNYQYYISAGHNCAADDTVWVNLYPEPELKGPAAICDINASVKYWTQPHEGKTWTWQVIGNFSYGPQTGNLNELVIYWNTLPGQVILTESNGACSISDTLDVVASGNPQPTVNLGPNLTICRGDTALLDPGSGYATYEWQDLSNNQTFNATSEGLYYVVVTEPSGCEAVDSISVNFHPASILELGPSTTFCPQDSTVLDAGPGFTTYLWEGTTPGQTYPVSSAGVYSVEVTDAFNCTQQDSVSISFYGALNRDFTFSQNGADVTFTDASFAPVSWLWEFGDGTTDTVQNPVHTYPSVAMYTICLTTVDVFGCTDSICKTLDILTRPQKPYLANLIDVYPNPTRDRIRIEFRGMIEAYFSLYDLQGVEKMKVLLKESAWIDLGNIPAGVYFGEFRSENENIVKKVVLME